MLTQKDRILAHLLKEKEYDLVEVEMQLFENCNLRCAFCSQDHRASLEQASLKSLMNKADLVKDYMRDHPGKDFKFNLMGGEIFQDHFSDEHFENLFALARRLREDCDAHGKTARFMFTTNLIFEKYGRVESLLDRISAELGPAQLATSFDFVGRNWNAQQRELFKANVERLRERIRLVGVVLHRLSIDKMIEQRDSLFDWLYQRVPVVFEYYIPDLKQQDLFSPSDEDNLRAWKFLAKNYPNVEPIRRWLNQEFNEVKCCSLNRLTVLANDTISSCRYFPYRPSDFKTPLDRFSISEMALKFIDEQGCLSCSHFNRCGLHCFVQADRARREQKASCFIKEFFDEALHG
ncbi:MAG: hypothetical protein P4M08_10325 [Oligoflexia bacterium]|nr:hypothetical protein [Oligoflexia bacterium]